MYRDKNPLLIDKEFIYRILNKKKRAPHPKKCAQIYIEYWSAQVQYRGRGA
jgi:hypothetical protein